MILRWFAICGVALASFAIGGCARQATASAIAPLSTTDRAGNVAKIVQMVSQQCFDRAPDLGAFENGLKASGWAFTRTQRAETANPRALDTWDVPNVTVIRGQMAKDRIWVCSLLIKQPAAPSLSALRAALSKEAGTEPGADGEWWWNRVPTRKLHMTADGNGERGQNLFINVEIYRLPWWQGLLG